MTVSSTRSGNAISSRCGTTADDARQRRPGASPASGRPWTRTVPRSGCTRPESARTSVVLPLPLGPTTATSSLRADPAAHAVERRAARWPGSARVRPLRLEDHVSVLRSSSANSGTPTSAVITPTGSSSGRTTVRATTSERTRKRPPTRKTSGSRRPMQRPRDGADRVGHHQADEADDAAGGDARRGEQRGAEVDQTAGPVHVGAEVMRRLFAQGEQVEAAGAEADDAERHDRVGEEDAERLPRRGAEPAEQPEERVADAGRRSRAR